MHNTIQKLKDGIIVSCQAEGNDPFNHPRMLAAFAQAAQMGGAVAIRAEGIENISAIRAVVDLPIIGIIFGQYLDESALITPDFSDIENILEAGADIVALDVTPRLRPNGMDGIEFFDEVRNKYSVPLMADISTFAEGVQAAELGADAVATTLSGYTSYSETTSTDEPDFQLIEDLSRVAKVPVIAEGRIWTLDQARAAQRGGAFAVVVGSAITRPRVVTSKFVDALKK